MDRKLRRILLRYLRSGALSVEEISYLGAVTPRAVYKWVARAGIDLRAARQRYVAAQNKRIGAELRGVALERKHAKAEQAGRAAVPTAANGRPEGGGYDKRRG